MPYQQQEPEPKQDSETVPFNIPSKFLLYNGNLDHRKASEFFGGVKYVMNRVKKYVKTTELGPEGEITAATLKVMFEDISNEDILLLTQRPEPEPEKDFTFNIPSEFLLTNGTLDREKTLAFFDGVNRFFKPQYGPPEKITVASLKKIFEDMANGNLAFSRKKNIGCFSKK